VDWKKKVTPIVLIFLWSMQSEEVEAAEIE
jgi:hypothetical protein